MKILLVDDSKAVHALVKEMLEELTKITLQHVYDGKQAVEAVSLENFAVDLIFLDWEMPEMTGIEALPFLRNKLKETPIIMMTSKNAMADISEALGKGATDYMMKPYTKDILIGKINQILGEEATTI